MKTLNFIFLFVFLSSCGSYIGFGGTGDTSCIFVDTKDLKNEVILDVSSINQMMPNYCGLASLQMLLRYYGESYTQTELAELMNVSSQGVSPNQILSSARELGYLDSSKANCELNVLLYSINNEIPVIVRTYDANYERAHYMVVIGYNIKKQVVYVNDPANTEYEGYKTINFKDFEFLWNINNLGNKFNSYNLMLIIK